MGKSAYSWSLVSVRGNGTLIIDGNGVLQAKENDCYAVDVQDGATCTINSGTFVGNIHAVYVQKGKAVINGGSYSIQQTYYPDTSKAYEFVLNCYDANRMDGTASIEVAGGSFSRFNPIDCYAEGAHTDFVAQGYATTRSGDGDDVVYTVIQAVAQNLDADGVVVGCYGTFVDAVAAAEDGQTVQLLSDSSGHGVQVKSNTFVKGLTVDFAGHSYTVGGVLVGSAGSGTNAFQLLEGNKITFKNGSIIGVAENTKPAEDTPNWHGAPAIMIQNYCDLTLDNMVVKGGDQTVYTVSNNNGDVVIEDSVIASGGAWGYSYGPYAFDVCRFSSYPSVSVTVKGNSIIQGNVEVSGTIASGQSRQLNIEGGTFEGSFSVANDPANISISGGSFVYDVKDYVVEDHDSVLLSDGMYHVLQKGAESNSGTGETSGSVATSGVTVAQDEQKNIADAAVKAAESVANAEVAKDATEATIGGITVDTSAEGKADEVNGVVAAAKNENASVDVKLVVKADQNVTVSDKITEAAPKATSIPFELSVDMVTEVKNAEGQVTATASVPVKETASEITVSISVGPASIKDKTVTVARVHDDVVDIIVPESVNYETGEVVFKTGKFSDYAVLASVKSATLSDYTESDGKTRKSVDPGDFGLDDTFAFAGWCTDEGLTTLCEPNADLSTTVYPKFMNVSDLIAFKGGSLRTDLTGENDYSATSLRFGYEMHAPIGSKADYGKTGWTYHNPDSGYTSKLIPATNRWRIDGNGIITNLVISQIGRDGTQVNFSTAYNVTAQIAYRTKDGTDVVVNDKTRVRSVSDVAQAILGDSYASDSDLAYANGILGENQ